MKRLSLMLIFVLAVFLLCGCYDDKEIDETAYIIALGIDKSEGDGYNYTFQFSAPLATMSSEGSSGGADSESGKNPTVRNIVITAPDFYTAKNMTNNFLSKTVALSHLKLIVFSASVDEDGFLNHSQFMLREREVRPHTAVALAKTTAEEYLNCVNPELEANTAKYYELMSLRSNNVYSPTKKLADFVDDLSSKSGVSILPVACTDGEPISTAKKDAFSPLANLDHSRINSKKAELRGMAIFKNGQPVGMVNGNFAMLYNLLTRDIKSCTLSLKNPTFEDSFLTFRLSIPHPATYLANCAEKPCRISVSQGFSIEFLGGGLPQGFSSYDQLYAYADHALTQAFLAYFNELSRGKRADIMKIGDCLKSKFLTNEAWSDFDWENAFQSAQFDIDIYFV